MVHCRIQILLGFVSEDDVMVVCWVDVVLGDDELAKGESLLLVGGGEKCVLDGLVWMAFERWHERCFLKVEVHLLRSEGRCGHCFVL